MKISDDRYPILFLDIETRANEEAIALLDPPRPPRNLKDPEKIEAWIEEKQAEIIDTAPLDSDLGLIAAIGWAIGKDGPIVTDIVGKKLSEKQALVNFWTAFAECGGRTSGYNILAFDLPFLMKRSFDLGLKPSIIPSLIKYRIGPVYDLQMILCGWDYRNAHRFKWVCKRYGIEIEAEGVDGSMVKNMTDKELKKYLHSDVNATRLLHYRMAGYYFV